MDKGDIDNLETAAEKAITKLGEEAYMWQKEAIMWRNRYSELSGHIRSICLYPPKDKDVGGMLACDFEKLSTNDKSLLVELKGRMSTIKMADINANPEETYDSLMGCLNTIKDCINLIEKQR